MFTQLFTIIAIVATVLADPIPATPPSGQKVGGPCTIQWAADPTGIWKTMHIELMAGPNLNMQHLTTVVTLDGTDLKNNIYSYTCPGVAPNAPIYFYQFTSPFAKNTTWTTRFTIEGADGSSVPAPQALQPNGDKIPWGNSKLANPSLALPAPNDAGSQVNATSSSSSASSIATTSGSTSSVSSSSSSSGSSSRSIVTINASATVLAGTDPTSSSTAGSSKPSNAAVNVRRTPMYTIGAVAAFVVLAL